MRAFDVIHAMVDLIKKHGDCEIFIPVDLTEPGGDLRYVDRIITRKHPGKHVKREGGHVIVLLGEIDAEDVVWG